MGETGLDHDALHLVEAEFVPPAVIKLGGTGRGVVGHRRRLLERAAVLQVGRDAGAECLEVLLPTHGLGPITRAFSNLSRSEE